MGGVVLPWELDPSIPKGDVPSLLAVIDMLGYEQAWTQFLEDPDKLDDSQAQMIEDARYLKRDLWPNS